MPWEEFKLNDGNIIPSIAFGTWTLGNGQSALDQVDQAIYVGFSHIDTAQAYRNEEEAGTAIRESGLSRSDIYISTKYSGVDGLDIKTSIQNSLKKLGVSYVDLYLIHSPRLAKPDIPTSWKVMEELKSKRLTNSIGVSNFKVPDLAILLQSAKVVPAVNQIELHPYVYAQQAPLLKYCAEHGIVIEGYSPLIPLRARPGGAVDAPVNRIAQRLGATPDQVLIAWAKSKGAVVVTTSSKKSRLEGYLAASDLRLTTVDITAIDAAGVIGAVRLTPKTLAKRAAVAVVLGGAAFALGSYFGLSFL